MSQSSGTPLPTIYIPPTDSPSSVHPSRRHLVNNNNSSSNSSNNDLFSPMHQRQPPQPRVPLGRPGDHVPVSPLALMSPAAKYVPLGTQVDATDSVRRYAEEAQNHQLPLGFFPKRHDDYNPRRGPAARGRGATPPVPGFYGSQADERGFRQGRGRYGQGQHRNYRGGRGRGRGGGYGYDSGRGRYEHRGRGGDRGRREYRGGTGDAMASFYEDPWRSLLSEEERIAEEQGKPIAPGLLLLRPPKARPQSLLGKRKLEAPAEEKNPEEIDIDGGPPTTESGATALTDRVEDVDDIIGEGDEDEGEEEDDEEGRDSLLEGEVGTSTLASDQVMLTASSSSAVPAATKLADDDLDEEEARMLAAFEQKKQQN